MIFCVKLGLINKPIYLNVARGLVGSRYHGEAEEPKRKLVKEAFADELIAKLPEVGIPI